MVWTTPAIDPKLGLVIFSTGNPNPDLYGTSRAGDNLYTDSIVALDATTGKLRWYYPEVKHDVWDYDAVSNVVLFDTVENGKTVAAAGEAGKVGWFFVVDRATGRLIRKSDPYVMMSKNMFSMPTKAGVEMLPGANGGAEWSPPAYSPETHLVYILAMDELMKFTTSPPPTVPGQIRLGSAFNVDKNGVQDGPFVALNVDTGKIAWQYMAPQPLVGGALRDRRQCGVHGRGQRLVRCVQRQDGRQAMALQFGCRGQHAAGDLSGERHAVRRGRGGRQLPAWLPIRRRDRDFPAAGQKVRSPAAGSEDFRKSCSSSPKM